MHKFSIACRLDAKVGPVSRLRRSPEVSFQNSDDIALGIVKVERLAPCFVSGGQRVDGEAPVFKKTTTGVNTKSSMPQTEVPIFFVI
jgi:hypothetical protein